MKNLKRLLCSLLALSLLFLSLPLTSCHGARDYDPFALPQEFDTGREYEIVFWAKNEKNIKQTKVYQQAIADFEKLYPNIKVTMKLYSDYTIIYRDVINNIPTRTTPNVCITYPDHIATYMTGQNVVVPLDGLLYDERFGLGGSEIAFDAPTASEIVPEFLEEGKIGGVQYALPFMRSTEALYYNKDYVLKIARQLGYDDIPEVMTWDFVFEISNAALAKGEDGNYLINGQKKLIPFLYKSTDNMMIQMLRQYGGEYSTEDGDILIFNDTAREILHTVVENTDTGAFSTFKTSSYPADLLNRGQCLFAVDSTAGSVWMGTEGPLSSVSEEDALDFELGISVIPQAPGCEKPVMISQGPSVCLFNKDDPGEVLASWIFLQYLLSNDVQLSYSATEGYVPVTTKAQESAEYLDYLSRAGELDEKGDNYQYYAPKIEVTKLLLDNIDNTFITPVFNGSASLRMASGEMIEQVLNATIAKPKRVVDDAFIDKLYTDMVALYRLDNVGRFDGGDFEGGLPAGSVLLIVGIGVIWCGIGTYLGVGYHKSVKEREEKKKKSSDT